MCVPGIDPLTLALLGGGLAASTGGAMMNANAQNEAIAAQNAENRKVQEMTEMARREEEARQMGMEEQQAAEVAEALTKANPAKALVRAQREVASPDNAVKSEASYNSRAPEPVKNRNIDKAAAPKLAKGRKRTDTIIDALAMLTAMGTEFAGMGDAIQQSGSDINTLGSYRRGSLNANRLETSLPAAEVTADPGMLGDLLMLGGGLASGVGGRNVGGAGGIGDIFKRRRPQLPPVDLAAMRSGGLY